MEEVMLTTIDNPFDPFTQFDDWFAFDQQKGYFTCELLGRIAKTSNDFVDVEEDNAIQEAIDSIINLNPLGIYAKFYKGKGII